MYRKLPYVTALITTSMTLLFFFVLDRLWASLSDKYDRSLRSTSLFSLSLSYEHIHIRTHARAHYVDTFEK